MSITSGFSLISEKKLIIMYYISLERSFNSASAGNCCVKIHAEMAEKIKYQDFIFTAGAPVYTRAFLTSGFL